MCNDINAILDRTAVDRCRECVVDDERYAVSVSGICKFLKVKNRQRRVGDGFAENSLRVRLECCLKLFLCAVRGDKSKFDSHLAHCYIEQVECAAVDGSTGNNVITGICDIEYRKEVRCLSAGSQHTGGTALHSCDFGRNIVVGRVLKPCIEISGSLQVEKFRHVSARIIFESCALINRNLSRLTVFRSVTTLHAFCLNVPFCHDLFAAGVHCCVLVRRVLVLQAVTHCDCQIGLLRLAASPF